MDCKNRGCRNWFDKFRSADFSLKDEQRPGRPNEVDNEQIKAIIESDCHVTLRQIEEMLKIPKSTIDRHIQRLELVKKLNIWIFLGKGKGFRFLKINYLMVEIIKKQFSKTKFL